jgi:hypothetical protein
MPPPQKSSGIHSQLLGPRGFSRIIGIRRGHRPRLQCFLWLFLKKFLNQGRRRGTRYAGISIEANAAGKTHGRI